MKVRATRLGYYGDKRKRIGEVFTLKPHRKTIVKVDAVTKFKTKEVVVVPPEAQFSEIWMERVEADMPIILSKPQKKFGPGFAPPVIGEPALARAAQDAPSDEEALEAEAEAEQDAAAEAEAAVSDQDVL